MNNWITQVVTVTGMNIRSLPQRWGSTMVAVVGIAGVVMVMVGILSIAAGLVDAMTDKAPKDIAIVLRAASTGEMDSIMSRELHRMFRCVAWMRMCWRFVTMCASPRAGCSRRA